MFGQILAVVVAIAVNAVVSAIPVVGPFLAPIAANAASQGVLIATGNQATFGWSSIGQTALRTLPLPLSEQRWLFSTLLRR